MASYDKPETNNPIFNKSDYDSTSTTSQNVSGAQLDTANTFSEIQEFTLGIDCNTYKGITSSNNSLFFSGSGGLQSSNLQSSGNVNLLINNANATPSAKLVVKSNSVDKLELNTSGLDVKSGEIFYNEMELRNVMEILTNKTINATNNTLTIASADLTDTANIPLLDGNNTFANTITGNISGNNLVGNYQGFSGRLSGNITGITDTSIHAIGGWLIGNATTSRNGYQSGMTTAGSGGTVNVPANFTLNSGIFLLNANIRVKDYEQNNGNITLFFSTLNGSSPATGLDNRFPQSVQNRRVLQDEDGFTMSLNCTFRMTNTDNEP